EGVDHVPHGEEGAELPAGRLHAGGIDRRGPGHHPLHRRSVEAADVSRATEGVSSLLASVRRTRAEMVPSAWPMFRFQEPGWISSVAEPLPFPLPLPLPFPLPLPLPPWCLLSATAAD